MIQFILNIFAAQRMADALQFAVYDLECNGEVLQTDDGRIAFMNKALPHNGRYNRFKGRE